MSATMFVIALTVFFAPSVAYMFYLFFNKEKNTRRADRILRSIQTSLTQDELQTMMHNNHSFWNHPHEIEPMVRHLEYNHIKGETR